VGAVAPNKKKTTSTSTPVYEATNSKRSISVTRAQRTSNFESLKCRFTTAYTRRRLGLFTVPEIDRLQNTVQCNSLSTNENTSTAHYFSSQDAVAIRA
jgi:hypothetical protein